ncbi:hypothetical protein BH11VER1_BH11VER1_27920 [soil metagenome]
MRYYYTSFFRSKINTISRQILTLVRWPARRELANLLCLVDAIILHYDIKAVVILNVMSTLKIKSTRRWQISQQRGVLSTGARMIWQKN